MLERPESRGRSCWPTAPTTATRLRQSLAERGAWANVKPMPNRKNVPSFSPLPLPLAEMLVERFFNKIKHYRGVATRYDKRAENYLAGVKLASVQNLDAI